MEKSIFAGTFPEKEKLLQMNDKQLKDIKNQFDEECHKFHDTFDAEAKEIIAEHIKSGVVVRSTEPYSPFAYTLEIAINELKEMTNQSSLLSDYTITVQFSRHPETNRTDAAIIKFPDLPGYAYVVSLSDDPARKPDKMMQKVIDYRNALKNIMDLFTGKIAESLIRNIQSKDEDIDVLQRLFEDISEAESIMKLKEVKERAKSKLTELMKKYRDMYDPENKPYGMFVALENIIDIKTYKVENAPFVYAGKMYMPYYKPWYFTQKSDVHTWLPYEELPASDVESFNGKKIGDLTDADIESGIDRMLDSDDNAAYTINSKY